MLTNTYSNNLNSIPNINYKDMLQLEDPERKGLLYGSLISAILGAGISAATGGGLGEAIARGLQAGSAAISEGSKGLRDYKKMVLEATRLQQQDEMAWQANQREQQKHGWDEAKHNLGLKQTGLSIQAIEEQLRKQREEKEAMDKFVEWLLNHMPTNMPTPDMFTTPHLQLTPRNNRSYLKVDPLDVTKYSHLLQEQPKQSILGNTGNINQIIAKGLKAGLDINKIKDLYGLLFPRPEITTVGPGQQVLAINKRKVDVLHEVPLPIKKPTQAPTSTVKEKNLDTKLLQQATDLAKQNPRFFALPPPKQEEMIRQYYNTLKNTLQGTTPNTGKSNAGNLNTGNLNAGEHKTFVEVEVKKLNGRHFLVGTDKNGKKHLITEIE